MLAGKDGVPQAGAPPGAMPQGNHVLDALDETDAALICPHLEEAVLPAGQMSWARPAGRCPG